MKRKCLIGTMLALLVMSLYVNMACAESFDDFLKEKYEDYKKDFQKLQKEHPEEYPFSLLKSYDMWQQEHYANGDITKWMEQWQRDHPDDDDWKKKFESGDQEPESGDKEPESDDKKPSDTLWAQEPSQIATALLILSEMFTLQRIVSDQEKMLKRIDDDKTKYNAIVNSRQKILDGIEKAHNTLANSTAFTHHAASIDVAMKARYPDWSSRMTIAQAADRINERNAKWRASVKDYLKALNANTSNYDNDQAALDSILAFIKEPAGQTQAIQAMGALLDHMNMMLYRDQQALEALITTYAENKLDLREERNDLDKAVREAGSIIKIYRPATKKCSLGF